ncbi:hypothetical protein STEG23_029865 [Scotinomys teguina]
MTVTPLGWDQDCSLKIREPEVPAPWFLDPGGWSKTAAVSLYFIFPRICTLSLPVGSERTEMRMQQMCSGSETQGSIPSQQGTGSRGSNACCFCWCCCCSCSCLTVRNQEDQRPGRSSHELRTDIPACEESPTPTLEEVCAWAQSFDNLMVTPAGRNAFREFLRTEFSEENMLFWMACEELKREANKSMIEEKAKIIYEDYISILSPKESSWSSLSLDPRICMSQRVSSNRKPHASVTSDKITSRVLKNAGQAPMDSRLGTNSNLLLFTFPLLDAFGTPWPMTKDALGPSPMPYWNDA